MAAGHFFLVIVVIKSLDAKGYCRYYDLPAAKSIKPIVFLALSLNYTVVLLDLKALLLIIIYFSFSTHEKASKASKASLKINQIQITFSFSPLEEFIAFPNAFYVEDDSFNSRCHSSKRSKVLEGLVWG